MAEKTPTTASQVIREYLAEHGDATPKEIQGELEKQGIEVSSALIRKVKRRWAQARGNGKAKAKPAAKAQPNVQKSQAIREHLDQHPDASPSETAALLTKKHGIEVTPKDVSQMKYDMKKQRAKSKKRATRAGMKTKAAIPREAEAASMEDAVDNLAAAKALAERLGGIDRAKQALDLLAKLT